MPYSIMLGRHIDGDNSPDFSKCKNKKWSSMKKLGWDIHLCSIDDKSYNDLLEEDQNKIRLVIGSPTNIEVLRAVATIYNSNAVTASTVRLFSILYSSLGPAAFSLVEGPFNYIEISENDVFAATDPLGMQPLNVVYGKKTWLTSELKNINLVEPEVFQFYSIEHVVGNNKRNDNYLPIHNATRLKPGSCTKIYFDGADFATRDTHSYYVPRLAIAQNLSPSIAKQWMADLLNSTVQTSVSTNKRIVVPLSGGLDSSMVTALAQKKRCDIETFALGTGRSNEFPFAKIVSDHLGTKHREINFSTNDIIKGINQSIYQNEIFDGLSAEIQSTLMCFYQSISGSNARIVTGYGSDLLFGGILKESDEFNQINSLLWDQIYRTRWTGELSSFGAAAYGLDIQHPFWRPAVIGFASSLTPKLKISERDVKIALRECVEEHNLLPQDIVWRKKIGIHEGSSVNNIFADYIKTETDNYSNKTSYSYKKYMLYLNGHASPEDV